MTPLTPPPVPIGVISFAGEILSGWTAAVTAQLSPLSIATVEEWYPQAEGEIRQYKRSELPAIWARCEIEESTYGASGTLHMTYAVHWGVVTENADPQSARRQHAQIRENVTALFSDSYFQGTVRFLSSGYQCSFDPSGDLGEPTQADKSPFRTTSVNKMRVMVAYPNPALE